MQPDYFTYGLLTPVLAYLMSCAGSGLGLMCTSRARGVEGRSRGAWLGLAALAIGGTGIWVMHFIAMLGFTVGNMPIRYNVPITLLSAIMAVVVVGIGLAVVGYGGQSTLKLVTGGLITGLGVVTMHYIGMGAMRMNAGLGYDPALVALSIIIAVVAATAALWFALRVRGAWATFGATLIMGAAVTGMHYTGMVALRVTPSATAATGAAPPGSSGSQFLLPLVIGVSLVAMFLLVIILLTPGEAELRRERELEEQLMGTRVPTQRSGLQATRTRPVPQQSIAPRPVPPAPPVSPPAMPPQSVPQQPRAQQPMPPQSVPRQSWPPQEETPRWFN